MAYNRVPPITLPPHVANIFEASVGCGGLTIPTTLTKMNGSKVKAAYNKTLERQMSSSTADWPAARYTVRNHQPELQIVPPTIAFAQYWFEFL
ncbi:BnaC02g48670D [Brassica napus]|uniref:BnaC02g48670D protein n=1 Tax=Brassica napus TaxID=3708 RepID=A0A078J5N7_BRANA|nr:BnaC02g48670D [Brassica napus]